MKRILFLNGTIGVGKTTLGTYIQERMEDCIFIDADTLCFFGKNVYYSQLKNKIIENLVFVINNYLKSDVIDTIIIAWIFDNEKVNKIVEKIDRTFDLYFFLLDASPKTIEKHLSKNNYPAEQITFLIKESERWRELLCTDSFYRIETDNLSLEEIYKIILKQIKQS